METLRQTNPTTHILLIENMEYTTTLFDQNRNKLWQAKNVSLRKQYELLKSQGDENIHYFLNKDLIGNDGEV